MNRVFKWTAVAAMAMLIPAAAMAAEPAATSRLQVTAYHLKPGKTDQWIKAYKDTVVPALKKAGIPWLGVSEQIFGDRPVYTTVRPLDKIAEYDGPGVLERAGLTQKQRDAYNAVADDCIVSVKRFIANQQNEFNVPTTGPAPVRVLVVYRANPGQGEALRAVLRTDALPAARQAKQAGRIAGWGVATTGQGNPGLTAVWTDLQNFAALDAPNALSQTMGAAAYALYQSRLAQVAVVEDVIVQKQVADLGYAPAN
jgi:hypothetical protein